MKKTIEQKNNNPEGSSWDWSWPHDSKQGHPQWPSLQKPLKDIEAPSDNKKGHQVGEVQGSVYVAQTPEDHSENFLWQEEFHGGLEFQPPQWLFPSQGEIWC